MIRLKTSRTENLDRELSSDVRKTNRQNRLSLAEGARAPPKIYVLILLILKNNVRGSSREIVSLLPSYAFQQSSECI